MALRLPLLARHRLAGLHPLRRIPLHLIDLQSFGVFSCLSAMSAIPAWPSVCTFCVAGCRVPLDVRPCGLGVEKFLAPKLPNPRRSEGRLRQMTTSRPVSEVRKGIVSQSSTSGALGSSERHPLRGEPASNSMPVQNPKPLSLQRSQVSQARLPDAVATETSTTSEHLLLLRRVQVERIGSGLAKWVFATSLLLAAAATVAMLLMLISR